MWLLFWACTDGGPVERLDADGDGYYSSETEGNDCNDADATVNPLAVESCDGIDNDCDSHVDDADPDVDRSSATEVFEDEDGDSWGAGIPDVVCTPTEGQVTRDGDCDDDRTDVHPEGVEVCDDEDVDEDCDGLVDDADDTVDPTSQGVFHADEDGDGFGSEAEILACDLGEGRVVAGADCDDTNAAIHPGAAEVCDTADADEDCDGVADDADASVDLTGATTWYPDADGDGYGAPVGAPECDADAGDVATGTDCDDEDPTVGECA